MIYQQKDRTANDQSACMNKSHMGLEFANRILAFLVGPLTFGITVSCMKCGIMLPILSKSGPTKWTKPSVMSLQI
jgi:hypothetical protein